MIPKIIHYCWFGKKSLPEEARKCIESWKKYCPDYEIKEWNEDNFDINSCVYVKEAYNEQKWAFVTDFVRLKVIYDYGGIYMDTDVEVCKSLDPLLKWDAFSGFESNNNIPTGIMGGIAKNEWMGYLLSYYKNKHFKSQNGEIDLTTNVTTITKMTFEKYKVKLDDTFQVFGENMVLYPFEYLCAKDHSNGIVNKTNNTYTIHHFSGSWIPKKIKIRQRISLILQKTFGVKFVKLLKNILNFIAS